MGKIILNGVDYSSSTATGSAVDAYNQANAAYNQANNAVNSAANINERLNGYDIKLGYRASANDSSVAVGNFADVDWYAVGIGNNVKAKQRHSTAVGDCAKASTDYSTALGYGSNASYANSLAVGSNASASEESTIALGHLANASVNQSIALGYSANASGNGAASFGSEAKANGYSSAAIGWCSSAFGNYSTALGHQADASENYSLAMGFRANASNEAAIALGKNAKATGQNSTTIGYNASVEAHHYDSIAIGTEARVSANYSTAIGYNAATSNGNSIQLGDPSYLSSITSKVTIVTQSDERDKTDIEDIDDKSVEFLNKVRTIRYVFNGRMLYINDETLTEEDREKKAKYGICAYDKEAHANGTKKGSRKRIGVSAQSVQKALEEVFGNPSYANLVNDNLFDFDPAEIPKDVESQLAVNYEGFIPFLIKAVQELDARIKKLEKEGHTV